MPRYWQDIQPGEHFTTALASLSKQDILEFAAEFDPQPYHLDNEAAEASIFGGLCASGWQVSAIMMRLLTDTLHQQQIPVTGMASVPKMRWKKPVFAGDTLSAEITVSGREADARQPGSGSLVLDVQVFNQAREPVIELTTRLMIALGASANAN